MPEIQEVRSALMTLGNVSLLVTDSAGEAFHEAACEGDALFARLLAAPAFYSRLLDASEGTQPTGTVQRGPLAYWATRVALDGLGEVVVLAGPVRGKAPSAAEIADLAHEVNQDAATLAETLAALREATPEREALVKTLLQTYARVLAYTSARRSSHDRDTAKLDALYDIATKVNGTLSREEVGQTILDSAMGFLGAMSGTLMLVDRDQREMTVLVAHGLPEEGFRTAPLPLGEGIPGQVALEGRSCLLPRDAQGPGSPSILCVPLKARNEVIGVLDVSGKSGGGDFSSEDRELLETMTASASAAMDNAQLFEEMNRRAREFSALFQISSTVNSSLQLEKVLEAVLENATSLLDAQAGSLMLLDEARAELRILTAVGLPEQIVRDTRVPVGTGISGKVALEGKARLLLKGVRETSSVVDKKARDMKSAICVPLKARDQVIGVLNVSGKKDGGNFSPGEMELLEILGGSVAFAIHNAKLYEKINRSAQQLSALFEIGNAINSSLERDKVLQEVLDRAIQLLNARKGSLMLLEEGEQELRIVVAHGLPKEIIATVRVPLGKGISGGVALEGKPRLLLRGERASDSGSAGKGGGFTSAISVPIKIKDKLIGVLNISDRATEDNFTDDDVELLLMMANQAAIALENARLMADLHELFVSSIKALANAIDARDPYTRGHSERVTEYSVRIAEELGINPQEVEFIRYAALLHDIGKINIPDQILNKPGKLTDEEFAIMQRHPAYGAQIMEPVKAFHHILPYMYHHHEKFASGGYPSGKPGGEVPLAARIITVADAFDAMTSDRPYRKGFAAERALGELTKNSGTQFDPQVVDTFVHLVNTDPTCRPEHWITPPQADEGTTGT